MTGAVALSRAKLLVRSMQAGSFHGPAMHRGPASRLQRHLRASLVIAALVALLWQSLIVQAHVHFETANAQALGQSLPASAGVSARQDSNSHKPSDCILCREKSLNGSFVTPIVLGVERLALFFATQVALPMPGLPSGQRSHAWRSRGPPAALRTYKQ